MVVINISVYGFMATALTYLLSTTYWSEGIVPCIILKIFLVKGTLLISAPIAVGAFVIGQGTGILIGKLIGIKLLIGWSSFKRLSSRIKKYKAWNPLNELAGWKAWKPKVGPKSRHHQRYSPPHHFNFHSFPPIRPIKNKIKSYGTPNYNPESEWRIQENICNNLKSGKWLPTTTIRPPASLFSEYERNRDHVYNKTVKKNGCDTNIWNHLTEIYTNYLNNNKNQYSNTSMIQLYPPSTSDEASNSKFPKNEVHSSDLENYIKKEVLKLKSGNLQSKDENAEHEIAKTFLSDEFAKDVLKSIYQGTLPDFVPMPEETEFNQSRDSEEKDSFDLTSNLPSKMSSILSTLKSTIQYMNPINHIPNALMSLAGISDTMIPNVEGWSRRKGETNNAISIPQITYSIVKDIKNLFRIVSFLDINSCLQKMVCEIHSQEKKFSLRELANSYEGNIITAFRIAESIIPKGEEGSTLKYLKAARLGKKYGNSGVCIKHYVSCLVPTKKLIQLGSIMIPNSKH